MSLTPNDLKKGVIFLLDGQPYESLEYKQKVLARQSGLVTVKAKNLKTNKLLTYTFKGGEDLALADLSKKTVSVLYQDDKAVYFMDLDDFSQYSFLKETLGDKVFYLAAEQKVILVLFEGEPLNVELPKNVWLKVESTVDKFDKGDTSSGQVLKPAVLQTDLQIRVPAFIKVGDIISVDTTTGTYRERQK